MWFSFLRESLLVHDKSSTYETNDNILCNSFVRVASKIVEVLLFSNERV